MESPVRLDVFADIVCPWCLVGHRRLARALAEEPPGSVEVRWRAFQLNPEMPEEGIPRREYYERKFGSAASVERLHGQVVAVGREEGIEFDFDAAERAVNTRTAHRAVKLATAEGAPGGEVMDVLMTGYLVDGADVGDPATVTELLERRGLAPGDLAARLATSEGEDEIDQDLQLASQMGLHAVPAFVADASLALSGAHEPALLRKLFAAARQRPAA